MIERLEALLKAALEEPFARIFPGKLEPLELASALRDAARDGRVQAERGTFAPNRYVVWLSPEDYEGMTSLADSVLPELTGHVAGYAGVQDWRIGPYTQVVFKSAGDFGPGEYRVEASFRECPQTAFLQEESGMRGSPRFDLGEGGVLGRGADCDFVLNQPEVSRKHCEITYRYVEYEIEDLGSANGTFVNGEQVQRTTLNDADLVEVGLVQLRFFVE